jgi:hypothetical protein
MRLPQLPAYVLVDLRCRLRSLVRWVLLFGLHCLLIIGVAAAQPSSETTADDALVADDSALLDDLEALFAVPDDIEVQTAPDGTASVPVPVHPWLLARSIDNGHLQIEHIASIAQARAFLHGAVPPTITPALPVIDHHEHDRLVRPLSAELQTAKTTIVLDYTDLPGVGFFDGRFAAPVGGNTGTTVGEQRRNAFAYAVDIWAARIQSTVPIRMDASFASLPCNATSGVLGGAGTTELFINFTPSGDAPGPQFSDTFYPAALAEKLAGRDLQPFSTDPDIVATFNRNIGTANCLAAQQWYYGLDGNAPEGAIDLVTVLLHEISHGLGFISFVGLDAEGSDPNIGRNYPYDDPFAPNDVWNHFLVDRTSGRPWASLSAAERAESLTSVDQLVWNGAMVTAEAATVLRGTAILKVILPAAIAGDYVVGEAQFGAEITPTPVGGYLSVAQDPADAAGPSVSDGCSPLVNAQFVSGTITLIDRGNCSFVDKVRNAQAAGAVGVVLADNQDAVVPPLIGGSDATLTIPVAGITRANGTTLRTALATGPVWLQLWRDQSRLIGADDQGRLLMFAPAQSQPGSSVSHFDRIATPNLLMEPAINRDIDQSLDLTDELLYDIGWFPDRNFNAVDDNLELRFTVDQQVALASATLPPVPGTGLTLTVQVSNTAAVATDVQVSQTWFGADQLADLTWTAVYSGSATGPTSGMDNINATLSMPAGSAVTFVVTATTVAGAPQDLISIVEVRPAGPVVRYVTTIERSVRLIPFTSTRILLPTVQGL